MIAAGLLYFGVTLIQTERKATQYLLAVFAERNKVSFNERNHLSKTELPRLDNTDQLVIIDVSDKHCYAAGNGYRFHSLCPNVAKKDNRRWRIKNFSKFNEPFFC